MQVVGSGLTRIIRPRLRWRATVITSTSTAHNNDDDSSDDGDGNGDEGDKNSGDDIA